MKTTHVDGLSSLDELRYNFVTTPITKARAWEIKLARIEEAAAELKAAVEAPLETAESGYVQVGQGEPGYADASYDCAVREVLSQNTGTYSPQNEL